MEWKKLGFSEQFLWPGRKVVSGFSLGVGASLIVLTLLFLNSSLKVPVVTPLFQGYNITRPLSLSTSSSSGVANATDGGGIGTATSDLPSAVGLGKRVEEGSGVSKIHGGNVSDTAKEESILGGHGESHLGNFIDEAGNGSLSGVGDGRVEDGGHARNGSVGAIEEDESPEKPILGMGISASNVTAQNITGGNCVEGSSCDGNYSASVSGSAGDVSFLGKVGRFHGGEESNLGTNLAGTSDEKSNITGYDSHPVEMKRSFDESCDIFDGRWVRDDTKPYYPAGSCPYIDKDFDCQLNGRPDDGFLKWKWQPNGCEMPSLNATDFLERLRGKKLVFVGDSLNRNMWESLVCILRHSVQNKTKVYEISGRSEFKKKGFYAFRFEDYSCSVDFVGAPFLVRESVYNSRNGSLETLRLDLMDRTTSMYHDADVIVFNTGHWWTHEKTSRGEDYYQEGDYVYPRLKVLEAYKRALTTWARWVDENIDHNRTQVLFRGYSVTHFRRGRWNSGGQCHKEVDPIFNDSYLAKYPSKMRALEYVLKGMKTPVTFLNISKLTDYRKDGHPSIYRTAYKTVEEQIGAEKSQDCSHWCLPGVPDTWNELLYATLLQTGRGSWRN